jgi:NAD(P)-dependent dehydrogenase (short-subunit alcohol dehydrogenase family)
VAATITAAGGECLAVAADVRRPEALAAVMTAIEGRWGRLDVLVNGAAGNFLAPAATLSANGFGTVIDIDLKGTFNSCKAALPLLERRGGVVINISATLHYGGHAVAGARGEREGGDRRDDADARGRVGAGADPGQRDRAGADRGARRGWSGWPRAPARRG